MKITTHSGAYHERRTEALVVPIFEDDGLEDVLISDLERRTHQLVSNLKKSGELTGKELETVYAYVPGDLGARRILFIGAGKRQEYDLNTVRRIGGTAARLLRSRNAHEVAFVRRSTLEVESATQSLVEGILLGLFEIGTYRTEEKEDRFIEQITLIVKPDEAPGAERGIERGQIMAKATNYVRNLVNEPSSVLTPTEFSLRATELAQRFGLDVDVLDEQRIKELGMGSFLGVARGSDEPAKMIVLTYTPERLSRDETFGFVGKGITFDSGGISIKPHEGMERMKYDMAGGAAVLGALRGIAQIRPPVRVIGRVPATGNMPGGRAQKPGDIVRAMSGKTIEVINTDAEGRLILADGISYARRLGANKIIDLATLTGSCVVALGTVYAAIMGNNQDLIDEVIASARESGEKLWQLPLDQEYREQIKSEIADIKNVGGRKAGTITAAHFLREFADPTPWVHLDIAGTAWVEEKRPYLSVGPTGMGTRTLIQFACRAAGEHLPH